ncbi:hypothetical protein K504DRAFT_287781 [Pleomassaria siparia CBS 279.74]|uniref:Uncharacterized protein n=1 Tax=Pleomassaria siparia CBS 279.74 TaxID=1314801 RepID=A0A6G1K856_9PLEO|nr:hypothetical protein K504DRAFT_287781 [Pleomassaria siparia CBS 279.74]
MSRRVRVFITTCMYIRNVGLGAAARRPGSYFASWGLNISRTEVMEARMRLLLLRGACAAKSSKEGVLQSSEMD